MQFKSVLLLLIFSSFIACQNKQEDLLNKKSPYEELLVFPDSDPNNSSKDEPRMEFETTEFDFGSAIQKEKVEHTYFFENTGQKNLLILDTESSCGCTVPHYSKAPIKPGEKGEVKIVFDTDGKSGDQEKKVTIFANTNPNKHYLIIKGHVISNE
jgi:hypothetical protein